MTEITEKEFKIALQAAEEGNSTEQIRLADCYRDGNGVEEDKHKAFELYMKAAEQGDPEGQVRVGDCFERGIGVKTDEKEAFNWYYKAARQGYAKGQIAIGDFYCFGDKDDESEAFKWYMMAADQNDPEGQISVGKCFEDGIGVEENEEEAFKWYSKAAEQGNAEGRYNVGCCYEDGIGVNQDEEQAFINYVKSAYQGYSDSQNKLGFFYSNGIIVEKDEEEAFKWYLKAAKQGNADGEDNTGICFLEGIGVEKDEQTAFDWFMKASKDYSLWGMIHAGNCYRDGVGVEKDEVKAFEQYYKAADSFSPWGMIHVGDCYRDGIGVDTDDIEAFNWYLKAARKDNALGQARTGDCLMCGKGVETNEEKAYGWYRKAAEKGYPYAQRKVGECLSSGSGVEKDEFEAFIWFERSAVQGDQDAQIELGNRLFDGNGTEKNETKAIEWFEKAAEQENINAQLSLLDFYYKRGSENDCDKAFELCRKMAVRGDVESQKIIAMCCIYKVAHAFLSPTINIDHFEDWEESCFSSFASHLQESDVPMVFEWIERAALQGDLEAQSLISVFYSEGIGVEKNENKAIEWEKKSGDPYDQLRIGLSFFNGEGVEKDEEKAFEWLKKAADQGDADVKAFVGLCFYAATGVEKDVNKAVKLVLESAEENSVIGLFFAGVFYGGGEIIPQDYEKALSFFEKLIKTIKEEPFMNAGEFFYSSLFFVSLCGRITEKMRLKAKGILNEIDSDTEPSIELFKHLLNNDFSSLEDCRSLFELCVKHREDSGGCAYILLALYSLSTKNNTEIFDSILEKNDLRSYAFYRKALEHGFPFHWLDDSFFVSESEMLNYKLMEAHFDWIEDINPDTVDRALSDCFKHLSSHFNISIDDFCNRITGEKDVNEYVFKYFKNWDPEKNPHFMQKIKTSLKEAKIDSEASTYYSKFDSISYKRDKEEEHFIKTLEAKGIALETLTAKEIREYLRLYLPSLGEGARERVFDKIVFPTKRFDVIEDDEGNKTNEEDNSVGKKDDSDHLISESVFFGKYEYIPKIEEIVREMERTQYVKKWVKRNPAIGTCVLASLLYEQIGEIIHKEDIIQILGKSTFFTYDIRPLFNLFEKNGGKVVAAKDICGLIGTTEENYSQRKQIVIEKFIDAYNKVIGKNYLLDENELTKKI